MQATGVLLLLCTSAVLTEAFPTTTVKYEIDTFIDEILSILNNSHNTSTEENQITLPRNPENKECCKKNLEIFMNATQIVFKKNIAARDGIYHNLEYIQNFPLSGCNLLGCDCQKFSFPLEDFEKKLGEFLRRIPFCF